MRSQKSSIGESGWSSSYAIGSFSQVEHAVVSLLFVFGSALVIMKGRYDRKVTKPVNEGMAGALATH